MKSFSLSTSYLLPPLLVLVGPTASGKSALALNLAARFDGEIVSADSRQIYRGMDIGTAKPSPADMRRAPHHLIDIKNPGESYTVAQYKAKALRAVHAILKRRKLPILVGGTGLYIDAVVDNLMIPSVKPDHKLRAKLERTLERQGLPKVFDRLVQLDPEAVYIVDPHNPRRVVRALEITIRSGIPFSRQRLRGAPLFQVLKIGIALPRETLRQRIDARVNYMLRRGLADEVKLLARRYGADCPAFDAIGYREIIASLNGEYSLDEACILIKKNTLAYAKRQMTWFRRDKRIHWISRPHEAIRLCKAFLGQFTAQSID